MSGTLIQSAGRTAYELAFVLGPIVLVGGVAAQIPGGMLPLLALTEAANLVTALANLQAPSYFAHFRPLPGSTLLDIQLGRYPFANQSVAANAVIQQPLRLSMLMECPVQEAGGHTAKLATFTALRAALASHALAGGTYIVATPGYIYLNCILLRLSDVTSADNKAQVTFQWDFEQPLISQSAAQTAQNTLMSKLTAGTMTTGATSGVPSTIGSAGSLATPSLISQGANVAGISGGFVPAVVGSVQQSPL